MVLHQAAWGNDYALADSVIANGVTAVGRIALKTRILRHVCRLRIFLPTPIVASEVQIRYYFVRRITPYMTELPLLSAAVPAPTAKPNELFATNGWMTTRNDLSRGAWKIMKQGTLKLGWLDGIRMRQTRYFNIEFKPYTIRWKNNSVNDDLDMITGGTYFFIRYINMIGTAATTSVPEWEMSQYISFNPYG